MVSQNVIQTIADEYEIWINLQGFSIFLVWCFAGRAGCLMSVSYRLSNGYFYKIENIQQSSRGRDSVHSLRNENSSLRNFAGFKFYVEWYSCLINVGSSNTRCSTKSISVPRWRNLQFFNELINYCFIFPWQCGWSKPYNYIQNVVNLNISFMLRGWWPEFGEQMISATNTNLRSVFIMHVQKLTSNKHITQHSTFTNKFTDCFKHNILMTMTTTFRCSPENSWYLISGHADDMVSTAFLQIDIGHWTIRRWLVTRISFVKQ